MKKFTGLLLAAVLCLPAYAAQTKNTMKMVSYFPVPYVAYDTVSANNAMDIGILNQCAMDINKGSTNLGGSACSLYLYGNATGADLNRGLLNVAAGKLDLNSDVTNARIVSKKVQLGTSMTPENGWLDIGIPSGKNDEYDALYISSLKNTGNSFRVTSKEDGAKVNSFHMFNEISNDFPGCAGTVTWQELELAANVNSNETYTDIYLVCGGTASEPEDPEECQPPRGNSYTESCPDGQTGSITYTWNQSTCSYTETNNCEEDVGCTITSVSLGSLGRMTAAQIASADTCDGKLDVRFNASNHNLSKGQSCVDIVQTGSWDYSVSGTWTTGSANPIQNYWWSSGGASMGSYSNCIQSIQDKVWGKGSLPDANEMCKLRCTSSSHGEHSCDGSTCIFHYNCKGNQGWNANREGYSLWSGSLQAITCTEHKLTCSSSSEGVVSVWGYKYTCE